MSNKSTMVVCLDKLVAGNKMNEVTTLQDYIINYCRKTVCSKCNYYKELFGVCSREILPIERSILRNLDGRGNCTDIKKIVE